MKFIEKLKKSEQGSVTIYVLSVTICVILILLSIFVGVMNKSSSQYKQIEQICSEYSGKANNEKIDVLVTNLFKADSFAPIYEKYSKVAMGYNEEDEANPEDMEEYYSKEEIKKYGCIAIEIEKVLK